jgi:hypothetical protein
MGVIDLKRASIRLSVSAAAPPTNGIRWSISERYWRIFFFCFCYIVKVTVIECIHMLDFLSKYKIFTKYNYD